MQISSWEIFALTLFQGFAVMGISFLGVSISRKVSIGLIVLIAFVGIDISQIIGVALIKEKKSAA